MPDDEHPAIPEPPKPVPEDSKPKTVLVPFRGKNYPAVVLDGVIIGWKCRLPRGTGSDEWKAACKAVVM